MITRLILSLLVMRCLEAHYDHHHHDHDSEYKMTSTSSPTFSPSPPANISEDILEELEITNDGQGEEQETGIEDGPDKNNYLNMDESRSTTCPTPCPAPIVELKCPEPHCPSLPPVPPCPTCTASCPEPRVSLTCPTPVCPECNSQRFTAAGSPSPPLDAVPPGYTAFFGMGAYKMHADDPRIWIDARDVCADEGGHLAVPNSQDEADLLAKMINDYKVSWIHIGVHDLVLEGSFVTILGQQLANAGYTKWSPDQPNGGRGQNCCFLWGDGGMADGSCSTKGAFVCELSFVPRTP